MEENVRDTVRVYQPKLHDPRIVTVGGGHGMSAMLRGLKYYSKNLTAIVAVSDDGGGSGVLREELGMLPPGDIRNCIMALANTEPTMEKLLGYRFSDGMLAGQSFGNLFLAALNGISGSFDEAVRRMCEVLAITGKVLPVTNENGHLEAEFVDGSTCLGESRIFYAKKENDSRIREVRLVPPNPPALQKSVEAILDADIIVLGPGSLYTSIIPNFLVNGIGDAIRHSGALCVLVLNLVTQDGETEGYTGADHIRAVLQHGGHGIVDICLANNAVIPEKWLAPYRAEGLEQIRIDREEIEQLGVAVREFPLYQPGRYIRHDPHALSKAILSVWKEYRSK